MAFPNLSEFSGRVDCFTPDLRALGRLKGSDLSVVDLSDCHLSELGIQGLCKGSPNLKRLCLSSGSCKLESVDATVQSIVANCPKIETLSFDNWFKLTTQSMQYLSQLEFLRELNLDGCSPTSVAVQAFLRVNQRLESLVFCYDWDVECDIALIIIDSSLLACIGLNCPKLTKLMFELHETSDVTDASLTDMLRGCPLLEELRFAGFKKPNTLLPTLGACCPRLKRLFLSALSFTDNDVTALCQGCPALLSLRLPQCHYLSNVAVETIASHCKKLQELVLTESSTVTDHSMSALFSSCTCLRSVQLGQLALLTSRSVLALLLNCPLLQSLSLDWEYSLINDLIAASANESEAAELIRSKAITDETLAQIPVCCKELKILRLSHCHAISRAGVWALIDNCKRLTELEVYNCRFSNPTAECRKKYVAIGERYRGLKVSWF